MEEALEAGAPGFALRSVSDYLDDAVEWYPFSSQEAMFAVVGDFNGDGAADVALDGQAGDEWLVVVVLSEESAYAVRVLEGGPIAVADVRRIAFLRLRLRGTELQCMEDGDIALPENLRVLESDAIELMVFEKAASAWYFEAGEFHSCVTAD